ncbi:MAG: thiol:disulfide oxidoreductase [Polyangiaceae bacterium]|nr:thiol:disulfide oxidoreductase [Polyangiaceae bacterium]
MRLSRLSRLAPPSFSERLFLMLASLAALALVSSCSAVKPAGSPAPAPAPMAPEAKPPAAALAVSRERPEHAQAKVPVSSADPQWGSVDAPVTIVEFSDFECPFCSRVGPTLETLKRKYGPEQLRIVFKHNPLAFHRHARPAAEAATAVFMLAGSDAFWLFHDRVFAGQQDLSPENYEKWASEAGVQGPSLKTWLGSGRPAEKVDEDMAVAKAVGATGTPGFRVNGVVISGAQPVDKFVEVIDEQLAAAKQLAAAGTPARLVYSTLTDKNFVEPRPAAPPREEAEDPKVWAVPIAADDPQRGDKDALVTIVVFSEFQCPFCKRVESTLEELRRIYGKDLRLVWKDNPLPFHPRAMPAALLARQVYKTRGNDAFWKLHDALFESQPKLEDRDLEELVKAQGLAWPALIPALTNEKLKARISESMEQANDFQARGTPHFFINGRRFSGAQPLEAFKKVVDEELAKARALAEQGTPRAKLYAEIIKEGALPPPPERKKVALVAGSATRGNASAKVVIQIFSDFQCPFCRRVEPTLAELDKEFKGQLRFVWRHLPLPFHAHAQLAAEASEEVLAQKGPDAFWKYHDKLFEAQGVDSGLDRASLAQMADELGLDMARFKAALDNHVHAAKVKADADAADAAGINGTPAFVINDYYLSGAQPVAAFKKVVRLALKDPKKP